MYSATLKVPQKTVQKLIECCKKNIIPEKYHYFYQNLQPGPDLGDDDPQKVKPINSTSRSHDDDSQIVKPIDSTSRGQNRKSRGARRQARVDHGNTRGTAHRLSRQITRDHTQDGGEQARDTDHGGKKRRRNKILNR